MGCGPQLFDRARFQRFSSRSLSSGVDRSLRSRRIRQVLLGPVRPLFQTLCQVARDLVALIASAMRSRGQLAAKNLFLCKQLALHLERQVKPRRSDDAIRISLVAVRRLAAPGDRRETGDPHSMASKGFRLWWRWKSRAPGRPPSSRGFTAVDRHDGGRQSDLGRGTSHYHHDRNHQGLGNVLICPSSVQTRRDDRIVCRERMGGLLKFYHRPAA